MRVLEVIGVVLLLAGCVQTGPKDASTPAPSVTPVFASEEEALAAAEEAYAAYQAASDLVTAGGGVDPSPLSAVVTAQQMERELVGLQKFEETGWRSTGSSVFDSMVLQDLKDDGDLLITVYVCTDVSGVRLLDPAGNDVTPVTRQTRLPLEVDLVAGDSATGLLVDRSDVWNGDNFCE